MGVTTSTDTTRLELWLQTENSEIPNFRELLEELVETQVVDMFTIRYWREEMVLTDNQQSSRKSTSEQVREFKEWASENSEELLGFENITVGVGRLGPTVEVSQKPPVTLAEYNAETLVSVSPCTDTGRTVTERLEQLLEG